MHQHTPDSGVPRSVNIVIKGGSTRMSAPEDSQQKDGGGSGQAALPIQQQARCDDADLLALLKRLGLTLSPPAVSQDGGGGRGNGGRNGVRGEEAGGASSPEGSATTTCSDRDDEMDTCTSAPYNGSYLTNGARVSRHEGEAAAPTTSAGAAVSREGAVGAGTTAAGYPQRQRGPGCGGLDSRQQQQQQHDTQENDGVAAFRRANQDQQRVLIGRDGGSVGRRNGDGRDYTSSNSSGRGKDGRATSMVATGERTESLPKPGNGRGFGGERGVMTAGGGPCIEAAPQGGAGGRLGTEAAAVGSGGMVDLMRREITAREALLLGPILRSARGVTCLKLCYNHLKDGGAEAVSSAIENLPSLHTMDLGFNGIGDHGATSLARSLMRNRSLRTLYLSGNSIGAAGATALAESLGRVDGLETLHLSGNCIGLDGAVALAEALKSNISLRRLYIDGAGIKAQGAGAVAGALVMNSVLSDMHMGDNEIGDEGLERLAHSLRRNRSVRLLELCFNRITGAGVEVFAKCLWGSMTLRALRFDNNQIGDRGAQALAAALPTMRLETLELGFNNVATVGVAALMQATIKSPTLANLSLSGNALDAEAARAIQMTLSQPRCVLKRLSLDHTSLGKASEGFIANGVLSNRSLALVSLTGFRLGVAFTRLGMPHQVANFSNEQALEQVRLYWAKHGGGGGARRTTAASAAPSNANTIPEPQPSKGNTTSRGVGARPGSESVRSTANHAADEAYHARHQRLPPRSHVSSVEERGGRSSVPVPPSCDASRNRREARGSEGGARNGSGRNGSVSVTGGSVGETSASTGSVVKPSRMVGGVGATERAAAGKEQRAPAAGGIETLESTGGEGASAAAQDSHRSLLEALRKIAQMPFSAADLWSLHQHYFSPPVEPRSPALTACPSPSTPADPSAPPPIAIAAPAQASSSPAAPPSQPSPVTSSCGSWWLDSTCLNANGSERGREESAHTGAGVLHSGGGSGRGGRGGGGYHGFSAAAEGGVVGSGGGRDDDGVGAGARRCRRTSSMGDEYDDEVNSPRPPSKRYRNSSARIRIACFPAIQARIVALKSKADERGVLTILRQLKYLEPSGVDAQPPSAASCSVGSGSGTASASGSTGPIRAAGVAPGRSFRTRVGGGAGGGGERGSCAPNNVPRTLLTDAEIERIILEEL